MIALTSKEILLKAPKRFVQIDDTLHVFIGEDAKGLVDKQVNRALKRGQTVTENGVSRWIESIVIFNAAKEASARYIWHSDGNRVKAEKFLFTKQGGKVNREKLGCCWTKDF